MKGAHTGGVKPIRERVYEMVLAMHAQQVTENERLRSINPMGAAILDSADKAGVQLADLEKTRLVNEFSFDSSSKMAAYTYEVEGKLKIFASGAPESILSQIKKGLASIMP
jgi:magnesium-transporting ATPase (P-type)